MNNEQLINGLKALVAEANRHLEEIGVELVKALEAENAARTSEDYPELLCCKDKVAKLQHRDFIWRGRRDTNLDRINSLQK